MRHRNISLFIGPIASIYFVFILVGFNVGNFVRRFRKASVSQILSTSLKSMCCTVQDNYTHMSDICNERSCLYDTSSYINNYPPISLYQSVRLSPLIRSDAANDSTLKKRQHLT